MATPPCSCPSLLLFAPARAGLLQAWVPWVLPKDPPPGCHWLELALAVGQKAQLCSARGWGGGQDQEECGVAPSP